MWPSSVIDPDNAADMAFVNEHFGDVATACGAVFDLAQPPRFRTAGQFVDVVPRWDRVIVLVDNSDPVCMSASQLLSKIAAPTDVVRVWPDSWEAPAPVRLTVTGIAKLQAILRKRNMDFDERQRVQFPEPTARRRRRIQDDERSASSSQASERARPMSVLVPATPNAGVATPWLRASPNSDDAVAEESFYDDQGNVLGVFTPEFSPVAATSTSEVNALSGTTSDSQLPPTLPLNASRTPLRQQPQLLRKDALLYPALDAEPTDLGGNVFTSPGHLEHLDADEFQPPDFARPTSAFPASLVPRQGPRRIGRASVRAVPVTYSAGLRFAQPIDKREFARLYGSAPTSADVDHAVGDAFLREISGDPDETMMMMSAAVTRLVDHTIPTCDVPEMAYLLKIKSNSAIADQYPDAVAITLSLSADEVQALRLFVVNYLLFSRKVDNAVVRVLMAALAHGMRDVEAFAFPERWLYDYVRQEAGWEVTDAALLLDLTNPESSAPIMSADVVVPLLSRLLRATPAGRGDAGHMVARLADSGCPLTVDLVTAALNAGHQWPAAAVASGLTRMLPQIPAGAASQLPTAVRTALQLKSGATEWIVRNLVRVGSAIGSELRPHLPELRFLLEEAQLDTLLLAELAAS